MDPLTWTAIMTAVKSALASKAGAAAASGAAGAATSYGLNSLLGGDPVKTSQTTPVTPPPLDTGQSDPFALFQQLMQRKGGM